MLTSISLDNHNWIPTTDNRLLRRIIRDYRFRGYSARDTIARWPSVRRGEDKWIFPYQENADAMFNSAMLYELAALRKEAEPILGEVRECDPENAEAYRLLRFLRYFNYIPDVGLPGTSLCVSSSEAAVSDIDLQQRNAFVGRNKSYIPMKILFPTYENLFSLAGK